MEWKKDVNTNLGITVILVFAALFTIIDFYIICSHVDGYPFNELNGNVVNKDNNEVVDDNGTVDDEDVVGDKVEKLEENDNQIENNKLLSEDDALKIGNELFEKMGIYYVQRGPELTDLDGKVIGYIKNDDGSFSEYSSSGVNKIAPYSKIDIMKLGLIASADYVDFYCSELKFDKYNNDFYRQAGDRGGNISYIDTKLEIVSITADTIVFDAVSSYFVDFSYIDNGLSDDEAEKEYKTNKFILVNENGLWKISEFHHVY